MLRQSPRTFVEELDFRTTVGHGDGFQGAGVTAVVTDLGVLEPDPDTGELTLVVVHPGIDVEDARAATGWPLRVGDDVEVGAPPAEDELTALRSLRTVNEATG
jgi:acyl CoA:acetate/3-ketoacid CoA transferase beta subunit